MKVSVSLISKYDNKNTQIYTKLNPLIKSCEWSKKYKN